MGNSLAAKTAYTALFVTDYSRSSVEWRNWVDTVINNLYGRKATPGSGWQNIKGLPPIQFSVIDIAENRDQAIRKLEESRYDVVISNNIIDGKPAGAGFLKKMRGYHKNAIFIPLFDISQRKGYQLANGSISSGNGLLNMYNAQFYNGMCKYKFDLAYMINMIKAGGRSPEQAVRYYGIELGLEQKQETTDIPVNNQPVQKPEPVPAQPVQTDERGLESANTVPTPSPTVEPVEVKQPVQPTTREERPSVQPSVQQERVETPVPKAEPQRQPAQDAKQAVQAYKEASRAKDEGKQTEAPTEDTFDSKSMSAVEKAWNGIINGNHQNDGKKLNRRERRRLQKLEKEQEMENLAKESLNAAINGEEKEDSREYRTEPESRAKEQSAEPMMREESYKEPYTSSVTMSELKEEDEREKEEKEKKNEQIREELGSRGKFNNAMVAPGMIQGKVVFAKGNTAWIEFDQTIEDMGLQFTDLFNMPVVVPYAKFTNQLPGE